ncbi:MAG TPA: hypothetical protein VHQ20_00520, partial [Patescibacteria group bacterium]|nr:hypothetical protein [Patescibacteria group bacterium]
TTTTASNTSSNTSNNPFGDWTGVNNLGSNNNPFAGWSGVGNSTPSNSNPFGDWSGVANSNTTYGTVASASTTSNNPFGDWSGVNSTDTYTASGYSTTTPADTGTRVAYASNTNSAPTTNFVAPKTGVNQTAPWIFAGLLTLTFLVYRKRGLLFN